ncbi:MAG: hypothetical protein ABF391_06865, partial [Akkermansiaceae bacterium]
EHFGITDIEDLPNIGELRKVELPDGTEDEEEKKQETTSAEDAETQLALSAVEKPSNKTAEPSQGEAEEPPSEGSDSSEE